MADARRGDEIRSFILHTVPDHPGDVARRVSERFGITRQAANKHLRRLVDAGELLATGSTRKRTYALATTRASFVVPVTPGLQEDVVWQERVGPLFEGQRDNVVSVAYYAFTEMLNNVIDHSGSDVALVGVEIGRTMIAMVVGDHGIGIFEKIRSALGLADRRHAILELAKGKFTTDPSRHSGQGIFFTSRMCDRFAIDSDDLSFSYSADSGDWLIEMPDDPPPGTHITMEIATDTRRTPKEVFDRFSPLDAEMEFEKTHVPVTLARYGNEQLVSRSQAKRVLARFDRFREVMLDFEGVEWIGQAFADEIFRVYRLSHPEVRIIAIGANEDVRKMIDRASKAT